jgi:N-acetylglucosamine repressor
MRHKSERVEPALLRRMNERRLLEVLQRGEPSSRAALARVSGLTPPTVSKVIESLLARGLVEEYDSGRHALGRPGKMVRMATQSAMVLGVVIDADNSCVTAAGLDGRISEQQTRRFPTPDSYAALLDRLEEQGRSLMARSSATCRGVGVSVPGLVNERLQQVVFCPNLHLLDHQNPAHDLEQRLGVSCVLVHEVQALCLGERTYGDARTLDDFAMLDVTQGLGLGVVVGGRLLSGHSGMAGEIGHNTADPTGIRCGCGNRGCLETLATDAALVRMVRDRLAKPVSTKEVADLLDERPGDFQHGIDVVAEYLAIAIATVINTFNPTTIFVHGRLLIQHKERFDHVLERVRQRTLTPLLAECTIIPTRSSKRQGAIATIMRRITESHTTALTPSRPPRAAGSPRSSRGLRKSTPRK